MRPGGEEGLGPDSAPGWGFRPLVVGQKGVLELRDPLGGRGAEQSTRGHLIFSSLICCPFGL